jgi:hypothetical protein
MAYRSFPIWQFRARAVTEVVLGPCTIWEKPGDSPGKLNSYYTILPLGNILYLIFEAKFLIDLLHEMKIN